MRRHRLASVHACSDETHIRHFAFRRAEMPCRGIAPAATSPLTVQAVSSLGIGALLFCVWRDEHPHVLCEERVIAGQHRRRKMLFAMP
jgi:hypothetical protein